MELKSENFLDFKLDFAQIIQGAVLLLAVAAGWYQLSTSLEVLTLRVTQHESTPAHSGSAIAMREVDRLMVLNQITAQRLDAQAAEFVRLQSKLDQQNVEMNKAWSRREEVSLQILSEVQKYSQRKEK